MKIEEISSCQVCRSTNLNQRHLTMEDFYGNVSEKLVKICTECDTIHYINNGIVLYEFSVKVNKSYSPKNKTIYNE